jgi:hypothetical protein
MSLRFRNRLHIPLSCALGICLLCLFLSFRAGCLGRHTEMGCIPREQAAKILQQVDLEDMVAKHETWGLLSLGGDSVVWRIKMAIDGDADRLKQVLAEHGTEQELVPQAKEGFRHRMQKPKSNVGAWWDVEAVGAEDEFTLYTRKTGGDLFLLIKPSNDRTYAYLYWSAGSHWGDMETRLAQQLTEVDGNWSTSRTLCYQFQVDGH